MENEIIRPQSKTTWNDFYQSPRPPKWLTLLQTKNKFYNFLYEEWEAFFNEVEKGKIWGRFVEITANIDLLSKNRPLG